MLSIEKAREILWKTAQELTDDQVQNLLNIIYFVLKKTRDKGLNKPIIKH
jgi:hypothetical protein